MLFSFEQLTGAAGDLRELEYISALHQTSQNVRRDCSIRAQDIQLFLASRHGIKVTQEEVRKKILQGLGAGSFDSVSISNGIKYRKSRDPDLFDDDDEHASGMVLDLMEVVALLMIPTLLKARQQEISRIDLKSRSMIPTPPGMLRFVLTMILEDTTTASESDGNLEDQSLTPELLQQIFAGYGELDIANNKSLLKQMIALTGNRPVLDVQAFAAGLTNDALLYDIRNETRLTTNYQDVFLDDEAREQLSTPDNISSSVRKLASKDDGKKAIKMDGMERGVPLAATPAPYSSEERTQRLRFAKYVTRVYTAPSIDTTAGTPRSKGLTVSLWCTVLISYFVYWYAFSLNRASGSQLCHNSGFVYQFSLDAPWSDNTQAMACEFGASVVLWLSMFILMSIQGLVMIGLGSMGNHLSSPWWKPVVGALVVSLYTLLSFTAYHRGQLYEKDNQSNYLSYVAFFLGWITVGFHVFHLLQILLPRLGIKLPVRLQRMFTTSAVFSETDLKTACSRKLSKMARNALEIVRGGSGIEDENGNIIDASARTQPNQSASLSTHFAQALDAYAKSGKRHEHMGGFVWTWKHLISRHAFDEDGIFISTRLMASNISQFIVTLYILLAGISLIQYMSYAYDSGELEEYFMTVVNVAINGTTYNETMVDGASNSMAGTFGAFLQETSSSGKVACDSGRFSVIGDDAKDENDVCRLFQSSSQMTEEEQLELLKSSGLVITDQMRETIQLAISASVQTLFPSRKFMVMIPVVVGAIFAFITSTYLAVTYLPSVTTTILQLRSGGIPTLRDGGFNRYREAADQVSILTGSLFWGCLVGSVTVGTFIGTIVFFFVWQVTAYFAQRLVAILIGILVIVGIRVLVEYFFRCSFYTAFYRQKPAQANISLLGLEWASFALSFGFVFFRLFKLLWVSAFFIGRIDRPLLAKGVGRIAQIEIDNYPVVHTKDLLSHEAHRHPFIELLGVMYMMKLRYADDFGKTAGSCWRLLFVYALFPWLHRYRIGARPEIQEAVTAQSDTNTSTRYPVVVTPNRKRRDDDTTGGGSSDMSFATSTSMMAMQRTHVGAVTPPQLNVDNMQRPTTRGKTAATQSSTTSSGREPLVAAASLDAGADRAKSKLVSPTTNDDAGSVQSETPSLMLRETFDDDELSQTDTGGNKLLYLPAATTTTFEFLLDDDDASDHDESPPGVGGSGYRTYDI